MIRLLDIILSLIVIIVFFIFWVIVSIVICLESRGGVFYKQLRVGKYEKEFFIFKFRSMYFNSDKSGLLTVGARELRITKFGYYLRKYKIDEIPQVINILLGQMSFVGPRPEVKKYVNLYSVDQKTILNIKPGLTDYASIKYKNESMILSLQENPEKYYIEVILPDKIKLSKSMMNDYYIWNYCKILFLTVKSIFV